MKGDIYSFDLTYFFITAARSKRLIHKSITGGQQLITLKMDLLTVENLYDVLNFNSIFTTSGVATLL